MVIPITPVPKPRMTQSDRWRERPATARYYAFKDHLRILVREPLAPTISLVFHLPMPPSWSGQKREMYLGTPHQQKPDIDNLIKAVFDALCEDDSYIYQVSASKYWAVEGAIEIQCPR